MVWNPELIEQLTQQWDAGMSITQIGKNLGMTRNAVVGKAHRLGLTKRPSPILRSEPKAPSYTGPVRKWPSGDPKSAAFGFCGKPVHEGRPYCTDHCAVAYTGWTKEQDAVSAA